MSSGLVKGTSRWASTARIVFEVPSVTSRSEGLSPSAGQAGKFDQRYTISAIRPGRGTWGDVAASCLDDHVNI